MLSYASIESAIILAKLMRKSNVRIDGVLNGTLVNLLTAESQELLKNNVDFDMDDIEAGDYSKLITIIKEAHDNGSVVEADPGEDDEYAPDMHTVWVSNYTDAIGKAVANNISIVKDVVIPDVKRLYDELIELYNNSIIDVTPTLFVIEDIPLPKFVTTDCFNDLVETHSQHEAPAEPVIELSAFTPEVITKYLNIGAKKLGCIEDLENVNEAEKVDLIVRYIDKLKSGSTLLPTSPLNALITTSFFTGIVEDPYFNSGSSATTNKAWGDSRLHKEMGMLIELTRAVTRELKEGKIFSFLNKDINSLYPRPNADGELRTVKVYLTNLDGLNITSPLDLIITGLIVDNVDLRTVTQDTLSNGGAKRAISTWNRFTSTLSNSNTVRTKDRFIKEVLPMVDKFVAECDVKITDYSLVDMYTVGQDIETYLKNMKLNEDSIYKFAKMVVLRQYSNTNVETIFNVLESAADTNKDMFNIGCSIVNKIVYDFVKEQIAWSRG